MKDNFLTKLVSEQMRDSAPLDLLLIYRGLVNDVGGCLGHSDHESIQFSILGKVRRSGEQNFHPELLEGKL